MMKKHYDFFAANSIRTSQDIRQIKTFSDREMNAISKIKLAASGYANDLLKAVSRDELYLPLTHNRHGASRLTTELNTIANDLLDPLLPETRHFMAEAALLHWPSPWFVIEFFFKLQSPLMTGDEPGHYPIDNPVRKDTVFSLPLIAATSWKGLLWSAYFYRFVEPLYQNFRLNNNNQNQEEYLAARWRMLRLYGTEKQAQKQNEPWPESLNTNSDGHFDTFTMRIRRAFLPEDQVHKTSVPTPNVAGCLYCFPTFFDAIDVDIINPHDPIRRVGTIPIHLEVVPAGSIGFFRLIYRQRKALLRNTEGTPQAAAKSDFSALLHTIQFLFREYGFSAKRTSGYGIAEDSLPLLQGRIMTRWEDEEPAVPLTFPSFSSLTDIDIEEE